ncbi:hypothetical protein NW757_011759, partial [Fusarium falciforme]
ASSIITLRIIMIIMASIIGSSNDYFQPRMCAQIDYVLGESDTRASYPDCDSFYTGKDLDKRVLVKANMGDEGSDMEVGASLGLAFGPALWLAFVIHAIGIEIYLRLTPIEHERLRNISYLRQQEAGMNHPGRAGLTADRLGDATIWRPIDSTRAPDEVTRLNK